MTLYSVFVSLEKKTDINKVEGVPERAAEMVWAWEGRLWKLGLFSKKRRFGQNLIAAFNYLTGKYREDSFHEERSNSHKLAHGEFRWDVRGKKFTVWMIKQAVQRAC